MTSLRLFADFMANAIPYAFYFLFAMCVSLVLTPLCRELSRKLGMVDKPGPRRINTKPIPRGGGVAIFLAVSATLVAAYLLTGEAMERVSNAVVCRMALLATIIVGIGYADDKFGLKPVTKLCGQIAVALGAVYWAGMDFHGVFAWCPQWIVSLFAVFWIVGAMKG